MPQLLVTRPQAEGTTWVHAEAVAALKSVSPAQVVYEWARGTPFNEICGLTDVMEGSIVRAMVRLDETCRCAPCTRTLPLFARAPPKGCICGRALG